MLVLIFDVFTAEPTWYKVMDGLEEIPECKFLRGGTEVILIRNWKKVALNTRIVIVKVEKGIQHSNDFLPWKACV
jgi:hypothetical protein